MVAIFSGNGLGYQRSSASSLSGAGLLGDASLGRGGDNVMVNAATGNLIVNRRDEFLVGRGPDAAYGQTYNSQGDASNSWSQSQYHFLANLPATPNSAGSTITRGDGDGRSATYTYDAARGAYLNTDGGGAHDELRYASGAWTWTDGDSRTTETYAALSGVPGYLFLASVVDADGNSQTYTWNANGTLSRITNASGDYIQFTLGSNGLPTQITTYTSAGAAMLTRTRYAWDSLRRLTSVTVDLTPGDHSIADGKSYTTTYTYDGTSSRIASIAQTDGSRLDIVYTQAGSDYRVTKLTQTVASGVTRVTGLYYDLANRATIVTDPLGGQTILRYDAAGNLIQIVAPVPAPGATAPTTTFAYAANGDVASVTTGGRTTAFSYDANGNMTLSRAADGTTVTRTYGSKNELLTSTEYLVVDPDGAGAGAASSPITTRYAYDVENHLRFKVSGEGRVTEYRYDAAGNPVSILRYTANSYNIAGLAATASIAESTLAAWAAAVGDKTTIERADTAYDFRGNVSTVTAYSKTLADGSGDLASTYSRVTYVYDASGNLLSRLASGQTGSDIFVYDGFNRVVSSTDKAGAVTTFTFNDAATTTSVALAGGLTRVSVYNKAGELLSLTESGSDVVSSTTTAAFDALGRLRMQTDPTGRSTYYFYDSANRKVAEITGDGAMTEFGYDSGNRLVRSISYLNRLSTSQIALLSNVSAGGAGGANAGGVSAPAGSSLISNGSFETSGSYTATPTGRSNTDLPGWTKTNAETFEQVSSGQMSVLASDGAFWLDLESIAKTGVITVGSNLLVNGGFETSGTFTSTKTGRSNTNLPGWTKTNAETFEQVLSGEMGVAASEGSFWLDMESVAQTGMMTVGSNLLVNGSFDQSGTYTATATGRSNSTLPGWVKINAETFEQVATGQMGVTGTDGAYWLDLDSVPGGTGPGPNLLVNGSFEQSATNWAPTMNGRMNSSTENIPGWVKANGEGFEQLNSGTLGVATTDGSFMLDMESIGGSDSRMDISQTVGGLTAGQQLTLKFDYANVAGPGSGALEVYWNGVLIEAFGSPDTVLTTKTISVTTVAGNNTLRFKEVGAINGRGVFLDNVRLYATVTTPNGGNMDISQTVGGLTAGQILQLQFDHANRTTSASGSFEVWWNNTLVATVTDTGAAMQTKTYQLTAIAGNNTLRFKSLGTVDAAGASLDNVRLFAMAPVPSGGNMDISQTVGGLTAGQTMQLQFDHANRTTAHSGTFEVWWNGTLVTTVNSTGTAMQTKSFLVTAIAGNNVLRFKSLGAVDDAGASIDNVRLFATQPVASGGNMDISQTVGGLTAGQVMQLQFDHANRTTAASGSFEVWWNGALVATVNETGTAMQTKTYYVTAVAGSNTLRFKSLGTVDDAGASIDNVRLFAMQSGGPAAPTPTDPLAGLRPVTSSGDLWTWRVYDNADRLIETIDSAGRATLFSYDGASRMVSSTSYATPFDAAWIAFFKGSTPVMPYLPASNATTDRPIRTFYDNEGRLVGTLDGAGGLTQIFHNAAGEKIREIAYANPVAANLRATGTFAQLLASAGTSASDRRVDTVYDQRGLVRFAIDATGHPIEFVYDAAGQLVRTVDYAGAIATSAAYSLAYVQSQLSATGLATSASNRISRTVLDGAGRPVFSIDAEGATSAFVYDQAGRVIKETRYASLFTAAGDQSLAAMQSWASSHSADAGNRVTRRIYDVAGRVAYLVDAEGYVTEQRFDSASRLVQTIRYPSAYSVGDGATKTSLAALIGALPAAAVVTSFAYDSAGRLTDMTDGAGIVTRYVYDALGQVTDETVAWNTSEAVTLHRVYDSAGRVLSETRAYGATEAATTSYAYDAVGNLLTVTDPRGSIATRIYDSLGRVVSETSQVDASTSVTVTQTFNTLGQLAARTDARGYAEYFYYDAKGRQTLHVDREGYATRTNFNSFDDVASVVRYAARTVGTPTISAPPTIVTGAGDATTSFLYDRSGRVLQSTDAVGHYEQYTYDAFDQRVTVRNKLGGYTYNSFDKRGQLTAETLPMASYDKWGNVVAGSVTNRFTYDSRGNRTQTTEAYGLAEQRVTNYVYDKLDRLTQTQSQAVTVLSQTDHVTTSSVTPTESLKYNRLGLLIETIDALGARTNFYYDKLGRKTAELRQTAADGTGALSTYGYDANGNMLSSRIYGTAIALPVAGGAVPAAPGGEYRETTYTYDKLDRVKTTSVANVRTGAWNGSAYATGIGAVTTSFEYDAVGNVTKATNGNGASSFSYYDKASRRIAYVDQENYLTALTLNADGNVTEETRLANKVTVGVYTNTDPVWLRGTVASSAADRITQFGYDKNGRRTSETRLNISSYLVGGTGALTAGSPHSTIAYSYNGIGQVTQKTLANGDYTSFVYDASGRLTQESRAPFTDLNGATVRPTTFYFYDGLNNLSVTRQGDVNAAAGDRYTRYSYGPGGRMTQMTDASGKSYNYFYDVAGNVVRESYDRAKSDGTIVTEGLLYNRDLLGRATARGLAAWNGSAWVKGDTEQTAFDTYGDIAQRGVNGLWQEQFAYDAAGRMWRSNSGDGVWRFFVYDGNGNQTLVLESEGANLAGYTLDQALALATANGAYAIGGAYIDGINATINVVDKRGQLVQTRTPKRQLNDTAAAVDLSVSRTYNAYGEVASETDARGFTTDFAYNTMGRLIQRQSPLVSYTGENGTVSTARPTEYFYHDAAGRLIATRDANGNLTTRRLLAGTGHDGSEALVAYQYNADGGFIRNDYDVFGDVRISWDEISRRTDMAYDAMGRVTQITRPNGLVDYFGYDLLGQKTSHWNNFLQVPIYGPPEDVWVEDGYWDPYYGWIDTSHWETHTPIIGYAPDKELTDYDMQGRVTRQVAFGGDTTTTAYAWNSGIATTGMGIFGGWTETTTMANGRSATEQTDLFGRQVYRSDLGGHVYTFSYDFAGRMTQRAGTETLSYTWLNTGKVAKSFSMTGDFGGDYTWKGTTYGYDAGGNLTSERFNEDGHSTYEYWDPYYGYQYSEYSWSRTYKNATTTYDAVGRIATWSEAGSADMASASSAYAYDLAGNIRRSSTTYKALDHMGAQVGYNSSQDNWYRFDAMNRLVTKGSLVNGQITRAGGGVDYQYDFAGQRVKATRTTQGEAYIANPDYNPYEYWDPYYGWQGNDPYILVYYDAEVREDYGYDNAGALTSVRIAQGSYTDNGDGTVTPTAAPAYGALRASYTSDLMGRITRQIDWLGDGTNAAYDRTSTFNNKGQVAYEVVVQKQGADTINSSTSNDYGYGANYALGAIVWASTSVTKNGAWQQGSTTSTSYAWFEGAVQSSIATTTSVTQTTSFSYDGSGSLTYIYVGDGRPRSVSFVNDANGQAIKRDESDNNYNQYTGGDPHEIWHRFGGRLMGSVGNNGTLDTDYASSITNRTRTPGNGAFRFGVSYASMTANFDLSNEAITSYSQGVAAGGYTVRQGDTLETIAANLWGDSSLWYKLAEANGMSAPNGLSEGQRITIPVGVMKSHHNASTFRPFDPGETLGDVNPTTPQPQKAVAKRGGKCGVFGQILLVIIAVAVSVVTYGALTGPATTFLGAMAAGAVSGAAGSIASQAFGVATGIQDKFSWKGVAMAAISGAVGGGLGKVGGFLGADKFASQVVKGALGSAITQGIGVATGLQDKFDWVGVAAAGIGAGVSGAVARGLGVSPTDMQNGATRNAYYYAAHAISGMAGAIANAATRSVLEGSDFGDNIIAALPDVIGSTIGNMIADPIVQKIQDNRAQAAAQQAQAEAKAQAQAETLAEAQTMEASIPEEVRRDLLESGITITATTEGLQVQGATVEAVAKITGIIKARQRAAATTAAPSSPTIVAAFTDPLITFFPENTYFLDTSVAQWQIDAGRARDDIKGDNIGITFRVDYDVQMTVSSFGVGFSDGKVLRFITVLAGQGAGRQWLYFGNDGTVPGLGLTITYGQRPPTEPRPDGSVVAHYVDRAGWGARAPDLTNMTPYTGTYNTITLHHSGDNPTPQSVESVHRDYSVAREFLSRFGGPKTYNYADVGYNFMIGEDGTIYEGRSLNYEGAHVKGNNPGNIGIAMLGDYSNREMTVEQARSLDALMRMLNRQHTITTVKTHGQFSAENATEMAGARNQINKYLTTPIPLPTPTPVPPIPQPAPQPIPPRF